MAKTWSKRRLPFKIIVVVAIIPTLVQNLAICEIGKPSISNFKHYPKKKQFQNQV